MVGITRQIGTISTIDADRVQARAHLPECDNLHTSWFNVLQCDTQGNKDYWLSDVGKQVKMLLDANDEDDVILGTVYPDVDKPSFSDKNIQGTRFVGGVEYSYNRETHTLIIRDGIEYTVIGCGADVVLKAQKVTIDAPETKLTGDLRVRGKLIYEGDMAGSGSGDATATIHDNIEIKGSTHATDSMLSNGENSSHRSH